MAGNKLIVEPLMFQRMVEQVRDYALFLLDAEGYVRTWNAGAQRIKGYEPDEIIGQHFSVFYPREANERGWPAYELKTAAAEGRFEDEGWRLRKDGSRFWALVVITALRDEAGRLLGFSKITRDLTERMLHEEALRQSEERFRLLIEGVTDYALFMLDPEGVVSSWNTGAERILGYPRREIIGKHFSRFFSDPDIEAGKPWEELATARKTGRTEVEGWRVRRDGTRFWTRAVVTALHDATGKLRGFAKVTQDLTERRHVQDLEKAAKNVNEFIATLAHELRNPLAPIRTAVQVMGAPAATSEAREAMRQTIERQSAHLARIVDDMLDITRITRGVLHMERTPVNLAEVVKAAVEMAAPAVQDGRHSLDVDLPPQAPWSEGDAQRLTQLLANLLNNAARYTPSGGSISVRLREEDGGAVIRVRDTGRGIEPDMLERIFDMFVQGRAPLDRIGAGLGIGLALARRIAEEHGGSLRAASEGEGRGSEFTLRLPLLAAPESAAAESGPSKAQSAVRRVLVVDDNSDAASTLELLLKSLGHEVRVANEGLEALRVAEEFRPEVVLLDIGMPGLDGYEIARRLRASRLEPQPRIVAITGWGQGADRERSHEAGFDLHLVKPVDMHELERALGERGGATLH